MSVLTPVVPDVWTSAEPVRIVGMKLSSNMTVLRLEANELLVHSPVPLTPERRNAIEELGTVAHLVAPNTFHHLWLAEWVSAFPDAKVHAPSGLRVKRPDLRIDRDHDLEDEPAFEGLVLEQPIEGFRLQETVLLHQRSGCLVVADLVHNVGRPEQRWAVLYTRAMGFYDEVALSRMLRWTAFSDRRAARRSVDRVLAFPIQHLLVCHGSPVLSEGKASLEKAFRWLGSDS